MGPASVPASSRHLERISGATFLSLNSGAIRRPVSTCAMGWEQLIRLTT